jgi:DNA-binding Lrp family transcriptional regulator
VRRSPLPPDALDTVDRAIVNELQSGFPLSHHPFADCGAALGIGEAELIGRIGRLREIGAITRFGPFFDVEAMGGAFCLCAMAVPQEQFEDVVTLVNAHPEVAHNYERDHHFNMWFVLACEQAGDIAEVARRIEQETGLAVQRFPKLKEFFIGFRAQV